MILSIPNTKATSSRKPSIDLHSLFENPRELYQREK